MRLGSGDVTRWRDMIGQEAWINRGTCLDVTHLRDVTQQRDVTRIIDARRERLGHGPPAKPRGMTRTGVDVTICGSDAWDVTRT